MPANAVLGACLAAIVLHDRRDDRARQSARAIQVTSE
jgi:hypothetical protein